MSKEQQIIDTLESYRNTTEDKLEVLFKLQKMFDDYIAEKRNLDYSDQDVWKNKLCTAIITEACELNNAFNWKWWKNKHEIDWGNVKEEIIDLLHFILSLSIKMGWSASCVYYNYCAPTYDKSFVNECDKLNEMIMFQAKYFKTKFNIDKESTEQLIQEECMIIINVASDLLYYRIKADVEKAIISLWDCLMQLIVLTNLTHKDVFNLYIEKNIENYKRQLGTSKRIGYQFTEAEL